MRLNFKNNRVNALFFNRYNNSSCKVYDLYESIKLRHRPLLYFISKYYETVLINKLTDSLSEFFKANHIKKADFSKLILFANKDDHYPILVGYEGNYIKADWFDRFSKKNGLLVLFTPGGAEILKRNEWASKFDKWISFTKHFEFLEGLPVLEKERKLMFPKLIEAIFTTNEPKILKDKFIEIMEETKEKVSFDIQNYHDNVALIYMLNINQDNLEFCKNE
jgi:hypothetical protein